MALVNLKTGHLKTAVLTAVVVVLLSAAFQRNGIWVTKLSLWTDVAQKTPMKSRVHNSLGNCYMLLGKHFKAVQEYKIALALDKGNFEAYYNIAKNLEKIGLANEAVRYYGYFCKAAPPAYQEARMKACERVEQLNRELGVSGKHQLGRGK